MKYKRPELTVLGNASQLIQLFTKGGSILEARIPSLPINPAYDLDE